VGGTGVAVGGSGVAVGNKVGVAVGSGVGVGGSVSVGGNGVDVGGCARAVAVEKTAASVNCAMKVAAAWV